MSLAGKHIPPVTRLQKTTCRSSRRTKHPVVTILEPLVLLLIGTAAMAAAEDRSSSAIPGQGQSAGFRRPSTPDKADPDEASQQAEPVEKILEDNSDVESYQLSVGGSTFGSH